jgi:hypothetical protein
VVALQRSAGNRCVAALLARHGPHASPGGPSGGAAAPVGAEAPASLFSTARVPARKPLPADKWGQTETEYVTIEISAEKRGASWVPKATRIVGHYSIETQLLNDQEEVTGPAGNTTPENYCSQLKSLRNLGKDANAPGGIAPWFMVRAVDAHEEVHQQHLDPSLVKAGRLILHELDKVSIPDDGALDAASAKAALEASPAFADVVKEARITWDLTLFELAFEDHFNGSTAAAERKVVDPVIKEITDAAAAQSWPACPP